MLIYRTEPEHWKELQKRVADIFKDIGCEATVEADVPVTLSGDDGTIEVDVWVEDARQLPVSKYHIECKNWATNVPQEKVVVLAEYMRKTGANNGYVISKVGFQEGAYDHARGTNIELLTFKELQELFWEPWLVNFFDQNSTDIQQDISLMQHSIYPDLPWRGKPYGDLSHLYPDGLHEFDCFLGWHTAFGGRLGYLCMRYRLPEDALEPEMLEQELSWDVIDEMIMAANKIVEVTNKGKDRYYFDPTADNLRDIALNIRTEYKRIKGTLINSDG